MHDAWLEFACEWLLDTQDRRAHTQDRQTHMGKAVAWCHGLNMVIMVGVCNCQGKGYDDQVTCLQR